MGFSKRMGVETLEQSSSAKGQVQERKAGTRILVLAFRVCVVIVFALAAYFAVRRGVAAWYFSRNDPHDVELAVRWDPQNPQYADALAHLVQFYSENPDPSRGVQLCETATRLSPYDAHYWADLGSAYDRAGRAGDALRAFETARRLFPESPDINWRLANFYVRARRTREALPLLKNVLLAGGVEDRQVFSLASGAGVETEEVTREMLPAQGPIFVDYLNFELAAGNLEAAGEAWSSLLKSGLPFRAADAFPYFDALIREREVDAAAEVWRELADCFPAEIRPRMSSRNLVTNGDFDFPILDGGFDWRVIPTAGATVRIQAADKSGAGGLLRIEFDGTQNPEYGAVLELIRVQPRTRYEFSAETRRDEITTDSGPRFEIFDEYDLKKLFVTTPNEVGSSDWSPIRLSFQTGPDTHLIVVRIARPASGKFDNKISGTLRVRHVTLVEGAMRQETANRE
jgi:tetratricopeptide (TPR) repeat protein